MSLEVIHPKELREYMGREGAVVVDLREKEEYLEYHLPGAVNIPYEELSEWKKWLKQYPIIIFYCDRGNVSLMAARDMKDWDSQVLTVSGGVHQFRKLLE